MITGGLGPTKDDITKQILCEYFDDELILSQTVLDDIKEYFDLRKRTVNKFTESQAFVPSKCKVIRNRKGTAPGMWFEHSGKIVVSIPGVPYEMKSMMKLVLINSRNNLIFWKLYIKQFILEELLSLI